MRIFACTSIFLSSLFASAMANDVLEKDEFITSRNLTEKELPIFCFQANYQFKKHYEKISSLFSAKQDNLEKAKESSEFWKAEALKAYGSPEKANTAKPAIIKKYIDQLEVAKYQDNEDIIYLNVFIEQLHCAHISYSEQIARDQATLDSMK